MNTSADILYDVESRLHVSHSPRERLWSSCTYVLQELSHVCTRSYARSALTGVTRSVYYDSYSLLSSTERQPTARLSIDELLLRSRGKYAEGKI